VLPLALALGTLALPIGNGSPAPDLEVVVGTARSGDFWGTGCSGTLIAPRVVLTAAHCAPAPPAGTSEVGWEVRFHEDGDDRTDAVPIVSWSLHPDWRPDVSVHPHDVAIAELAEDAPTAPILVRRRRISEDDLGADILAAGYGQDDDWQSGRRRSGPMRLLSEDDLWLVFHADNNPGHTDTRPGDSGGAMLGSADGGRQVLWGTVSGGTRGVGGRSYAVNLPEHVDWLDPLIEDIHGSADLCAIQDVYDDGVCDTECMEPDPDCAIVLAEDDRFPAWSPGCAGAPMGLLPFGFAGRRRRR
jgi:V8-like Glu-specific endopeptidase